jgi:hypothetical protein
MKMLGLVAKNRWQCFGGTADVVRDVSDSEVVVMFVTLDSESTSMKILRSAKNSINSEVWDTKLKDVINKLDYYIFKRIFTGKYILDLFVFHIIIF